MQDQNQKNRQPGQGQQEIGSSGTNWQSQGDQANQSTENNEGNWDDNTEVDMPQNPRHKEEPFVGGQNQGTSNSPNSGSGSQMKQNQPGRTSGMGADIGNEGSNMGNPGDPIGMGGQSNQGEDMRGGSISDQGKMSDQRGNQGSKEGSGTDDYMRNEIGKSTSGSSGTSRNKD